jgi:hypothetical protein
VDNCKDPCEDLLADIHRDPCLFEYSASLLLNLTFFKQSKLFSQFNNFNQQGQL